MNTSRQRTKQLQVANKIEDKNIKRIEKQLKLNRRKSKGVPKSFVDDGLDFLLEVCDPTSRNKIAHEEFDFADNETNFEEDLALLRKSVPTLTKESDPPKAKKPKLSPTKPFKVTPIAKTIDTPSKDSEIKSTVSSQDTSKEDYIEDIYGRLRDKVGNVVNSPSVDTKYIPPGKRQALLSEEGADVQKLRRQLKGLLNRLAESNLPNILSSIEKLYLSHSRHNMQEALNHLVIESLVTPVLSPERLLMEYNVLIAALHANIGVEVGAQFLELVVRKFDAEYGAEASSSNENKEMDNLISILAHMYNFGIVSSTVLSDILVKLTDRFEEKDIDLILIVLRTVGFSWRKDDPATLKEIILNLQTKAGKASEQPPRIRFMLEILLAIRNNNMTKIPNFDPSHTEHLKKLLRSLTNKGLGVSKLNITYNELLSADKRGRWWIVGSAWAGQGPKRAEDSSVIRQESTDSGESQYSASLLELARKQRMNTELRRNIFCVLMTAEDFIGAFERLMRLGLKDQQEREIVHVIIDCCQQEKVFNPYYAHLLDKFCNFHRRFQIACQFALWDRFKDLSALSQTQISHLSKLVAHVTIEGSLSLAVLKVLDFTEMDRFLVRFLRQLLLGMYTSFSIFTHS